MQPRGIHPGILLRTFGLLPTETRRLPVLPLLALRLLVPATVLCHCRIGTWDGHSQIAGSGVVPPMDSQWQWQEWQEEAGAEAVPLEEAQPPFRRQRQQHQHRASQTMRRYHAQVPHAASSETCMTPPYPNASRARDRDVAHVGALRQREDALTGAGRGQGGAAVLPAFQKRPGFRACQELMRGPCRWRPLITRDLAR